MEYKILSHTADLRLEVFGKTIEELFRNAAEALAQILSPRSEKSLPDLSSTTRRQAGEWHPNVPKEKIEIQSTNINTLLVDFLNEILAKSQIEKAVYKVVKIKIGSPSTSPDGTVGASSGTNYSPSEVEGIPISLGAELAGIKVPEFEEDVKAVTYHEVNITPASGPKVPASKMWSTKLVLDI